MTLAPDAVISFDELADAASGAGRDAADILVVTVNNRYARRIIAGFARRAESGHAQLPKIVPFTAWLRQLGDQDCFTPGAAPPARKLDAFAARRLWEQVIARDEAENALLDVAQASRHAMDADYLASDGYAPVVSGEETDEYRRFTLWRRHYRAALARLHAEDDNLEYERVCAAVEAGGLAVAAKMLVLAGFASLSPRQTRLLAALRQAGVRVRELAPDARPARSVKRVVADEPDAEWRLAAQWAAECLERQPDGRFAIIAARLDADAAFAHRALRDALRMPAASMQAGLASDALQAALQPVAPYDIAVARPLGEWVHARAALAWWRVLSSFAMQGSCVAAELGEALLAGCCAGAATERAARARIDVGLRRRGAIAITEQAFTHQLSGSAPRLAEAWAGWLADRDGAGGEALAGEWVDRLGRWLRCIGFPGDIALDSQAYQVVEALEAALAGLARQEAVLGRLSVSGVLALLRRRLGETLFQPQRDPSARLEVLGFLESEGGRWDGVWVLGLTDDVLPAAPAPNPLIPLSALRRARAPRATPERELEWAWAMAGAFLEAAPEVWFSHARRDGERELRASPFLDELGQAANHGPEAGSGEETVRQVVRREARGCAIERVTDDHGPALAPGSKTHGGIAVLDTQARNPLWAFAKYRLGASDLPAYADLYSRNVRGVFLHRAVELVWRMLDDQAHLIRARDDKTLGDLIRQAVDRAGDECLHDYGRVLKMLETRRAYEVIGAWLAFECERPPFAVAALEQQCAWSFGPLALSLRVDRIDRLLGDDRLAIIDYKSGMGPLDPRNDWTRSRPISLQLPFYAAVVAEQPGQVAAMALARLHARKVEASGLMDGGCELRGLATPQDWPECEGQSWEQIMEGWRRAIEGLAGEYVAGRAANDVWNPADLDYCDALPFLRLNEEP